MHGSSQPGSELSSYAHPGAKQPDVLVIDIREQSHLPTSLPLIKRQHPSTGVVIVASKLDPALLLEAMRSGVNEFVSDPVSATDLEAAIGAATDVSRQAPGQQALLQEDHEVIRYGRTHRDTPRTISPAILRLR